MYHYNFYEIFQEFLRINPIFFFYLLAEVKCD